MELHNQVIISMDSLMELVAEAAAKTAIGVYNEEHQMKQKERRRRILRNTKLLLENYRSFKTHISRSVYDLSTATESAVDLLDMMWDGTGNTLNIQSIKQSVLRTAVIMDHITKMLKIYKGYCRQSTPEAQRQYRVIRKMYVMDPPLTVEQISAEENVDVRTVYRDINVACKALSPLFFGIDGIQR